MATLEEVFKLCRGKTPALRYEYEEKGGGKYLEVHPDVPQNVDYVLFGKQGLPIPLGHAEMTPFVQDLADLIFKSQASTLRKNYLISPINPARERLTIDYDGRSFDIAYNPKHAPPYKEFLKVLAALEIVKGYGP
jgi:hypothetical protein